jgi:glutaminyl-peptide cyclotransferase
MKNLNFLTIILLGQILCSCGSSSKDKENYFSFDSANFKEQYLSSESISLKILNSKNKVVDSIIYYVNDTKISSVKGLKNATLNFKDKKLGYQNLKALVYFEGENVETSSRIELVSDVQPKLLNYTIVNTYPHDIGSFTEGLEFYKDTLYESTGSGNESKSYFRKYDFKTGKIYKQVDLESQYFGEGITIINDKVFQITWQSAVGFIYNANTLKKEKTFNFDKKIEGWGMTNDGQFIYQSDGTEKIWKMNPNDQKMIDYINVYSASSKIKSINELEWIDGKIYGNIWQKDAIAVINPITGSVEGVINLTDLKKQISNPKADVLNGIAYNKKTKTIFVTGKNWDKLFEIRTQN